MPPEIYMEDGRFGFLVRTMTAVLRKPEKHKGDRRLRALAQLKLAGLDPTVPLVTGGEVMSPVYGRLIDVLAAHKPCPATGQLEEWQTVNALGEFGNIWPASVLADRDEHVMEIAA
jgi:hypothetical protein